MKFSFLKGSALWRKEWFIPSTVISDCSYLDANYALSMGAGAIEQFDSVWRGDFCAQCGRKDFCGDKITGVI